MARAMERLIQPGWVCANVGVVATRLARLAGPAGLVIAFEAHPKNVRVLCEKISAHHYESRVCVEQFAVSDGTLIRQSGISSVRMWMARPIVLLEFHNEAGWAGRVELFAAGYWLYDLHGKRIAQDAAQRVYHCCAIPQESAVRQVLATLE